MPTLVWAAALIRYGLRRPLERRPGGGSVTVAGLHGSIVGIGQGARATAAALKDAGVATYDWDLSAIFHHPRKIEMGDPSPPEAGPGVIIVQMNAIELVTLVALKGRAPFAGKRCIGYWAWELETIPKAWRPAFRYVDEIWTPSDFTSAAIRRAAPRRVRVRTVHHPVPRPQGEADRARFGWPDHGVAVLSALDIRSGMARKNPFAAIAAFRQATRDDPRKAFLVLKIGGIQGNEALFEAIRQEASDPNIHILTESLDEADRDRLVLSADILLSLHRSEGFGLMLAEAMLAGKAVIATDWSGNLDFMDRDSAALVPATLIPVADPQNLFTHGRWADPDVEVAAGHLRRLIEDPVERRRLGAAARVHAERVLDGDVIGRGMAEAVRAALI